MPIDPNQKTNPLPMPERALTCVPCSETRPHVLNPTPEGCAWICSECGGHTAKYTAADMRAMMEAYAGPIARASNLPPKPIFTTEELAKIEVDVEPKLGGDLVTYTGVAIERHLNATHALPVVGEDLWTHHPQLAPHIAKFSLGKVIAVRGRPTLQPLP